MTIDDPSSRRVEAGAWDEEVALAAEILLEASQRSRAGLATSSAEESALEVVGSVLSGGEHSAAPTVIPAEAREGLVPRAERLEPTLRRWLVAASVSEAGFLADREAFLLDGHATASLPPREILARAHQGLVSSGAIGWGHRVSVVWAGGWRSRVIPLRIPGRSVLVLPARRCALAFHAVHQGLGRVIELDGRPGHWPLRRRWHRDPRIVEGWAQLVASLSRDAAWLDHLGVEKAEAALIALHCSWEDRFRRSLAAAAVLVGEAAENERGDLAARFDPGLLWPGYLVGQASRVTHWQAVVAGHHWADVIGHRLAARHGLRWWEQAAAWSWLRSLQGRTYDDGLQAAAGVHPIAGACAG